MLCLFYLFNIPVQKLWFPSSCFCSIITSLHVHVPVHAHTCTPLQSSKCVSIHPDVISLRSRVDFCSSLESLVSSEQLLQCLHTGGGSLYHTTRKKQTKKRGWGGGGVSDSCCLCASFTTETLRPELFLGFLERRGGDEVEKEVVPGEMDGDGVNRK